MFETAAFFFFGLLFGSFANVLIWRIPRGESWAMSRSRCPNCSQQIAWYDNIPLVAYALLRGKCRQCHSPIAWRYPLVEVLMGAGFAGLYWHLGWSWTLLEDLVFLFGLVTVSFIDFDHMILPDVFTLSGIVIGLIGAWLNPEREFMPSLIGVVVGGGALWLVAYLYYVLRNQEGMGGGDIKLLAWIGAVLGWKAIPFVVLVSSIVGSVVGLIIAIRTKGGLGASIPFGPYLALGAIILLLGGNHLADWYFQLFLPTLSNP